MFMSTRLFRFILLSAGLFLLSSCISFHDIDVKDINLDNVTMQGSKIVLDFSAMVHNPNRTIVIQSAEGDFSRAQQHFAAVQLLQPITIAAKSEQRCSGQMQLSLKNLFAALQMGADSSSWDLSSLLFTGDVQVKSGLIKKKYKYKEIPVTQLLNSL